MDYSLVTMLLTIIFILVVALICGGAIYILDRMPFIGQPFNAIIRVVVIIVGILTVLQRLGLFTSFSGSFR